MKYGLLFYLLIIGLHLYVLIRACVGKYRHNKLILINLMIFTLLHISLLHYGSMRTGPAQLWGMHIALFILFTHHSNYFLQPKIFISYPEKVNA